MTKRKRAALTAAQAAGGVAAASGLFLLAGLAWALLAVGLVTVAVAVAAELNGGA
ncbi:hypothetical protein [Amycolatopsis thermoflava]|uniref:hypothetical protein n=1 Tax=Amycolatopsis thermoflava TaxID=84480 RepID=UPI003647E1F1